MWCNAPRVGRTSAPAIAGLLSLCVPVVVCAQTLPPGAREQLDDVVGNRVEATAVLGTQSAASGGGYGWKINDADGKIAKIPWKFELYDPRPIGGDDVQWTPVVQGGVGYGQFVNHFNNNVLAGNESSYDTIALSVGAGPRFYFPYGFSILPTFDFLYAYTENKFTAGTPAGEQVLQAADGRLVNWHTHTISFVPAVELRYRKAFGRWTPEVTSTIEYFHTEPISSSTDALDFRSDSVLWGNKVAVDYETPITFFQSPVHVGADFSRTDLYGGLRQALATEYFYRAGGMIEVAFAGRLWIVDRLGVGGGYFWSGAFDGYSVGLEASVKF
jgi:hypothetical protein